MPQSSNSPVSSKATDLGEELREPLEPIRVTHPSNDRTHVKLNGANTRIQIGFVVLPISVHKAESILHLLLGRSRGHINFITEDEEGHVREFVGGEEGVELLLGLRESAAVNRVHKIHHPVDGREVILPEAPRRLVAAKIEGLKLDLSNDQLVRVGVERWDVDLDAVLL